LIRRRLLHFADRARREMIGAQDGDVEEVGW
jgi:hypothetical protein